MLIGTTIGQRYKILKKIGGGGMAEVYQAMDLVLNREVAVKVLRHQYVHDEDFVKRFRREANAVASLSHKHVIDIYDIGEEKELYYIVMEYIAGNTLKEVIQQKGRIPVEEAMEIAEKICSAIEHAHQNQIIHRDIKPHNILIGKHGEVKVTDFGIARAISSATITHTGSVMGSVHYLSPEQARGEWTDEKTDLYSLGVVIYEMITGKLPFSGDSPITVALKHLQEGFVYPKEIEPSIPQSVENIILKALMKDPKKRYASAGEMLEDIQTALLPERLHEKQIEIDNYDSPDDEKTMVISPLQKNKGDDSSFSHSRREAKKKKFIRQMVGITGIILFLMIAVFGFQWIGSKWIVPDVKVPFVEGMDKDQAAQQLNAMDLNVKTVEKYHDEVKEGFVYKQEPAANRVIKQKQTVTLYVSLGKEKTAMPDLINKQSRQAEFLLRQQGFVNIEAIEAYDEATPKGEVFRQEPLPETQVIADETRVLLFVSKGKEKFEMPNLIGKTRSEAEAILTIHNLELGEVKSEYTFEQPKGKIFRQFPFEPGREVTAGDRVDIYVSQGYPKEAKTIYTDLIVRLDRDEQAEITIMIRDAREKEIEWKKETITGSMFYEDVPLILMPGDQGMISVYKNGELIKTEKIRY